MFVPKSRTFATVCGPFLLVSLALCSSCSRDCPELVQAPVIEEVLPRPQRLTSRWSYVPDDGFVPDKETAVRIAEAVLLPVYGSRQLESEKPWRASLEDDVWTVTGTLPPEVEGGTVVVELSKRDGRIIYLVHEQ